MSGEIIPYLRYALLVILIALFMAFITKIKFDLSITAAMISLGISYGSFFISSVISSAGIVILFNERRDILLIVTAILLQTIIIFCLFKIKRFSKGITFLKMKGAGAVGLVISGIIFIIIIMLDRGVSNQTIIWLFLSAACCVTGLIIWWRRGLTLYYRKMIKERNIRECEKIIAEKDALIDELRRDNEIMANLIHRDNKILPALCTAVLLCTNSADNNGKEKEDLLIQIENFIEDRAGILKSGLTNTGIISSNKNIMLDGIIHHMMIKASEKGIKFDIAEINDFSGLITKTITETKFYTILTDLIENAINATTKSDVKHVLISLSSVAGIYELCVQDSGIAFKPETYIKLGLQKASTRLDEGGSGIGYMTIFEILNECNAGLIITEYKPSESLFTKSVTIRFDNNSEYSIKTYRADELRKIFINNPQYTGRLNIMNY